MSRNRYSQKVDSNQQDIVETLRAIPGVTVQSGHDDILVGVVGFTLWYEIKSQRAVSKRTGRVRESEKKKSQHLLEGTWQGHYQIVSSIEPILEEIKRIKEIYYCIVPRG